MVWADAGSVDPFLNTVTPVAVNVDISDEDAARAWAMCQQSNSRFMWWTLDTARWSLFATERGMVSDGPVTLMEAEIKGRGESHLGQVETVDSGALETFFTVAEECFGGEGADARELSERFSPLLAAGRVVLLWAREDEAVLGTLMLHLGEGDPTRAGIYWVSVRHDARRRGVATALCEEALAIAARRGRSLAVLQSSALGVGAYARLGFQSIGELRSWIMSS